MPVSERYPDLKSESEFSCLAVTALKVDREPHQRWPVVVINCLGAAVTTPRFRTPSPALLHSVMLQREMPIPRNFEATTEDAIRHLR